VFIPTNPTFLAAQLNCQVYKIFELVLFLGPGTHTQLSLLQYTEMLCRV